MPNSTLKRIVKLDIQHFRGCVKTTVNTDADIVLLAGPNGYGKTSLIHALQLLLTGYDEFDADFDQVVSVGRFTDIEIHAQGRFESDKTQDVPLALCWTKSKKKSFHPDTWPQPLRVPGLLDLEADIDAPQRRLARITTFYPEKVQELFDTVTKGKTLGEIYQPSPKLASTALNELEKEHIDDIRKLIERLEEKELSREQLEAGGVDAQLELNRVWGFVRGPIAKLAAHSESMEQVLLQLSALETPTLGQLETLLAELKPGSSTDPRNLGADLMDTLRAITEQELTTAKKRAQVIEAPKNLVEERGRIEAELRQIREEHPDLNDLVTCFAPSDETSHLPDLLAVFRTLSEHRDRWVANAKRLPDAQRTKLLDVLIELEAVVEASARISEQRLKEWLEPLQEVSRRRSQLEKVLKEINSELEKYRLSQEVSILESVLETFKEKTTSVKEAVHANHRWSLVADKQNEIAAAKAQLKEAYDEVLGAQRSISKAVRPDHRIEEAVRKLANQVLSRFSLVEGVHPLQMITKAKAEGSDHLSTVITTESQLDPSQLSTSQRAQVAVALAIAQSQLVRDELPFHILLLDDVSSAYDLSNLTREAILWRQLAYNDDESERWQLFIASHHDDLTNHLLDLLIPPCGATMRLLKFTGWDRTNGPRIESYDVEPSENVSAKSGGGIRAKLADALKEDLCLQFQK